MRLNAYKELLGIGLKERMGTNNGDNGALTLFWIYFSATDS